MTADLAKARILANSLEDTGYFTLASSVHKRKKNADSKADNNDLDDPTNFEYGLPVVAFRFSDTFKKTYPHIEQKWVQLQLRGIGWIVPK